MSDKFNHPVKISDWLDAERLKLLSLGTGKSLDDFISDPGCNQLGLEERMEHLTLVLSCVPDIKTASLEKLLKALELSEPERKFALTAMHYYVRSKIREKVQDEVAASKVRQSCLL